MHNLWNSAFAGVTAVFHFIIMQRIKNIRVINVKKTRIIHHKNTKKKKKKKKKKLFITHQYGSINCKLWTPAKRHLPIYSLSAAHISTVLDLYVSEQYIEIQKLKRAAIRFSKWPQELSFIFLHTTVPKTSFQNILFL